MKVLILLATLLCYSNAKQLRVNQHELLSAEDSAFLGDHLEKHFQQEAKAQGLGVKFAWDPPALMLDDKDHGACIKAKVKLQLGMTKQLQGETKMVDTKSMNLDVEFGTSFIDHKYQPGIIPFLIVKVTILPIAKMFEKGWKLIQGVLKALGLDAASKTASLKDMATAMKGKCDQLKAKYPALAGVLSAIAAHTEFGQGLGPTNEGFAWTFALEDSEYKNNRPSVTFEWRPKAGTNSLTTLCVKIPALPNAYGASLGTCGAHKGLNFQFGLDDVNLGKAMIDWILPGGVLDKQYKDKPADKLPSLKKLKAAATTNIAAAKKSPGLILKFLQTVGKAILGGKLAFFAEIRFAAFLAVKVQGDVPIKKIIGDGSKASGAAP